MLIIDFEEIVSKAGIKCEVDANDDMAAILSSAAVSLLPTRRCEVIITGDAPQWALMAIVLAMRPWVKSIYYGIIDVKMLVRVFEDEE